MANELLPQTQNGRRIPVEQVADSTPVRSSSKSKKKKSTRAVPRAIAHNDGREALLELTIERIATLGPARVQPQALCVELGLSKSLVNFHFGGRDGLIGEALTVAGERYVDFLSRISDDAGPTAMDRLLAWVDGQIEWTVAHPGTACGLNFFEAGSSINSEISPDLRRRMSDADDRSTRILLALVMAARIESHGKDPDFVDDPHSASHVAATIGWLTTGESIWRSSHDIKSNGSAEVEHSRRPEREFVHGVIASLLAH